MNALLLVDLQNDFVAGGALAVTDGHSVIPVANMLASHFDNVIATQDWHPHNHKSFASQHLGLQIGSVFELNGRPQLAWPDHCIQDSHGAEFVSELNRSAITCVIRKGMNREVDSYSGFFDNDHLQSTGLTEYLREQSIDTLYIMGLATDYCVKFTALDAVSLGFEAKLIRDGVRGVNLNPDDSEKAIAEMRDAGVEIVDSEIVLRELASSHR